MCQENTVYRCKHSSYRKVHCSAEKTQRSSCFSFAAPPPSCHKTVRTQQSNQLCYDCLRRENRVTMWPSQGRVWQQPPQAPTWNNTGTQGFQQARLPQTPQAARLRLESAQQNTGDSLRAHHRRTIPAGVDLGSVAADAFHFAQTNPTQQPAYLIATTNVDTPRGVSPVSIGFAHARFVSPQTSVEELRAEAQRRVVDGLGNFF